MVNRDVFGNLIRNIGKGIFIISMGMAVSSKNMDAIIAIGFMLIFLSIESIKGD